MKQLDKHELLEVNGGESFAYRVGQIIRISIYSNPILVSLRIAEETAQEALAEVGL